MNNFLRALLSTPSTRWLKAIGPSALLLLALVSSGVEAQAPVQPPRTIRVVMDNAYAPYSFQSDDGKLQGILIDQWQSWERKTGIKAEIHAIDWGEALRRVRAGEFDVIDSIVETAERRDYLDFTPSYTTIEASIFFRNDISGISDLSSLKGFPVGVKTGDQHIDQLKANGVTTLILFESNDAIIEAARQHKINVFVVDDPSGLYLLNKLGVEEEFRHSAPVFRDELRRAVRKGDTATLRVVTEGFAAVDASELKQIDEKWFGHPINSYRRYVAYAGYAAAIAILIIAGLVGWNRTLRKRIAQRTAALGESEQRFRQIAENIREVFWMSTGNSDAPMFGILYISPAYESVWGRTCESLYQDPHSFIDAIHPEDRARVADVSKRNYEQDFEVEYRVVRPDGSMRWIRDRGFPIKDATGRFYRLTGIAEDITERKHAEEALDERLRFETLVTELSAAFANLSANEVDHQIDKWLQTLVEFLGVDRASFFQFGEDWTTLYRSHSYTVPGIEPLPPLPIGMKDQFPWIADQLRRGVTVKWSRIPDDMAERAVKEREYAIRVGVKSRLNIPVRMGGSVICAITFNSIVNYRDWPDETVARLRLVGEIFAAAVERKRAEAALHAKEQQFRAIVENAPDQIIRYDREFRRTYVNPAVLKAYGLPAESLIGKPVGSVIQDAELDVKVGELTDLRQLISAVFDTGKLYEYEMSWPAPAGRRYYSVRFFPELDLNGSAINVLGISRDITERRIAAEELKKEKEVLEKIFDNIPVMIGFVNEDGRVKLVNPEWERTMGWTLKELQEQGVDIFAEAYPDPTYRQEVLDFVAAASGQWVDLKIRIRDGQVIDAACAVVHLSDGTRVAIGQDITERKRAEEHIRATSEQLRALSAKLQSAKEEEDIRIAREIHDEMGSTLTSLRWDLERFDKIISEAEEWSQLQALRPKIADMMKLTDNTIGTMRRIASELRPSILDDLGLPEAIEWQAQQFQARTGIACLCDCALDNVEFDPDQSTAVFRIFQEALTNILSHADATAVEVVARSSDEGEFVLTISDNGKGITEDEKSARLSLGILGMRERAHLIGGEVEISGANGPGTVVTVRIPKLRESESLKLR